MLLPKKPKCWLLLGEAHRLDWAGLGNLSLVQGLCLRFKLLFELFGLGGHELGKSVTHPHLGRDVADRRRRNRGNLGLRSRRNNGGKTGVVDHPFRQFLIGTNANDGLVDRGGGIASHSRLLGRESIDREQQRKQHAADKQEITRYGHRRRSPPRRSRGSFT